MRYQRARGGWFRAGHVPIGLLALCASGLGSIDVSAMTRDERIRPDYSRADATRRPLPERISDRELPEALRITRPRAEEGRKPSARERSKATPTTLPQAIRDHAHATGRRMAESAVATAGRREYFRIGFYEGLNDGMNDPRVGGWDHAEGERLGFRDYAAHHLGEEIGERDAAEAAALRAEEHVAEQFSSLGVRPRYVPRPGVPRYSPALPGVPEPTYDEVFAEFPIHRFGHLDARFAGWLEHWEFGPGRLHRCRSYEEFYEAGWHSPKAAFGAWKKTRARSVRSYRELETDEERALFEASFRSGFADRVAELYPERLLTAYRRGLHEGWDYGVFVHREMDYRLGFHAGYRRALEENARETFVLAYDDAYERAYRQRFDDWSHNPKPGIGDVSLVDGNRDGVFEPGEDLLVDYELVNYGGGDGRFPVELTGPALVRPVQVMVDLPARASTRDAETLRAQIRPGLESRTRTRVSLGLADRNRELSLRVSYPLQLRLPEWRVEQDTLEGEVVLEVALENQSRLPVVGFVELVTPELPGFKLSEELGVVEAGAARTVPLEIRGLDPLDLLAGPVALEVKLLAGDRAQDSHRYVLAGTAANLGSRDLLVYMLELAGEDASTKRQVDATRELMMRRLHEDWRAAVAAKGNPYKKDFKRRDAQTALGDLVRTSRLQDPQVRQHPVFAGLSGDVRELAAQLPGAHPLLRKYVRKLAAQLP